MITKGTKLKRAAVLMTARSAITNGRKLLRGVNNNQSHDARRYRDLYLIYMNECDGRYPDLCKQCAGLTVVREQNEADLVNGKPIDQFAHARICNTLNRTVKIIRGHVATTTKKTKVTVVDESVRRARAEAMIDT